MEFKCLGVAFILASHLGRNNAFIKIGQDIDRSSIG